MSYLVISSSNLPPITGYPVSVAEEDDIPEGVADYQSVTDAPKESLWVRFAHLFLSFCAGIRNLFCCCFAASNEEEKPLVTTHQDYLAAQTSRRLALDSFDINAEEEQVTYVPYAEYMSSRLKQLEMSNRLKQLESRFKAQLESSALKR